MPNLYPELTPYQTTQLDVGDGHKIHLELSGNAKGVPVLFIHGGPGAGLNEGYRRFFNPEHYHIIGFDQRGCGQSTPFADLHANTTDHLIADIEQIRQYLGISSWLVFGGSWGSTLALVYAIRYSAHIMGLILRGTFLAREQDTDWFLSPDGGAASIFPEAYQDFARTVEFETSSKAICDRYYSIFTEADEVTQAHALQAWYSWEERLSKLVVSYTSAYAHQHFHQVKSLALLECHYLKNGCFIPENYIMDNVHCIADIPGTIIHGRYDMICKGEAAFALHNHWKNSELRFVPEAGHSTSEPAIASALRQATDDFYKYLSTLS
ncbi:prolyl aminopeptidase [Alteromonas facilis]|uniref:prolyl aminopeptidase n=1 Tax=Alteromonas facilis TaxID=2048004 RepID=UPI000C29047E|nr:prolyl aminopeptidase [Alteromonas facilis]